MIKKWKRFRSLWESPDVHSSFEEHEDFHNEIAELSLELEGWLEEAPEGHTALEYGCELFMGGDCDAHWCVTSDECAHVQKMADGDSSEHRAEMAKWLEKKRTEPLPVGMVGAITNWQDYKVRLWKSWERGWSTDPGKSMELLEALVSPRSDFQILTAHPSMELGSDPDDPIRFSFSGFIERGESPIPLDVTLWADDLKLAVARVVATLAARGLRYEVFK